jgi:hypothetical protein
MKFGLLILPLLVFSSAATSSEKITIYRWIDDSNIVHFSQHQPIRADYTQLTMRKTPAPERPMAPIKVEQEKATSAINNTIDDKKRCLIAQSNLSTLNSFDKIQYQTESGVSKLLSEKEKSDQLILNKQQVDLHCNK